MDIYCNLKHIPASDVAQEACKLSENNGSTDPVGRAVGSHMRKQGRANYGGKHYGMWAPIYQRGGGLSILYKLVQQEFIPWAIDIRG